MIILTKTQADSVIKYYSEKLIGKPIIEPGNYNPFPIVSLEIVKLKQDEFTIKCIAKYMGKTMFKDLGKVIQEAHLLPIEDFLSNQDL